MERLAGKETGTVITPDMVEALSREAEEGYDLDQGTVVHVARPPLQKGARVSPRLSFRVTQPIFKALHERAQAEGRRVSDVAREAIERYIRS